MLSKKLRLDIENFPKKAKTAANTEYFLIKTSENNLPFYRIGVLVGSRVSQSAVKRNGIKRITMNYCGGLWRLRENGGKDVLIVFKQKAGSLPKEELSTILKKYVVAI